MKKSRVVIDTNIILVSLSRKSPNNWIFQRLIDEDFEICVTTEILLEYYEIVSQKMSIRAAEGMMRLFDNLENVVYITTYFEFRLLKDPDDNKFVDCSIAADARYIVSHDKDFKVLKTIDFPKVEVIGIEEFKKAF